MNTRNKKTIGPHAPHLNLVRLEPGTTSELCAGADLEAREYIAVHDDSISLNQATFLECRIADFVVNDLDVQSSKIRESEFDRLQVAVLKAGRSLWSDVRLNAGRLGACELMQATWARVAVQGTKITYVNGRGAHLSDVALDGCVIDELDVMDSALTRVSLRDSTINRLVLHGATMTAVDLRGANITELVGTSSLRGLIIDSTQLMQLAPSLARVAGIEVLD